MKKKSLRASVALHVVRTEAEPLAVLLKEGRPQVAVMNVRDLAETEMEAAETSHNSLPDFR